MASRSTDERTSATSHLWNKGSWTSCEAEGFGVQGRGSRSCSRLKEVGASKKHITNRLPVPPIWASVTRSAVTEAFGHLLGSSGRIEVIALAKNGGSLTASHCVDSPSWCVVIVHDVEMTESTSAQPNLQQYSLTFMCKSCIWRTCSFGLDLSINLSSEKTDCKWMQKTKGS
jgi:hypothetical protein